MHTFLTFYILSVHHNILVEVALICMSIELLTIKLSSNINRINHIRQSTNQLISPGVSQLPNIYNNDLLLLLATAINRQTNKRQSQQRLTIVKTVGFVFTPATSTVMSIVQIGGFYTDTSIRGVYY